VVAAACDKSVRVGEPWAQQASWRYVLGQVERCEIGAALKDKQPSGSGPVTVQAPE